MQDGDSFMTTQLFEGKQIRFAPHDPDRDAEIDSKWSHDPDYLRSLSADPARPLSPTQIKKKYDPTNLFHINQNIKPAK